MRETVQYDNNWNLICYFSDGKARLPCVLVVLLTAAPAPAANLVVCILLAKLTTSELKYSSAKYERHQQSCVYDTTVLFNYDNANIIIYIMQVKFINHLHKSELDSRNEGASRQVRVQKRVKTSTRN